MKRFVFFVVISSLLLAVKSSQGGPVAGQKPKEMELAGLRGYAVTSEFNGGEQASVIVKGTKGATNLGLYVYDTHGNCVAWDDEGNVETSMIAAVDWMPSNKGTYTIEVKNNGFRECKCVLIVR